MCSSDLHTHRRAPTDYDADHVLLRTVRCVNGEVQLSLSCEPAFEYGALRARWEYSGEGYRSATASSEDCETRLRLVSDLNLGIEGPRVTARHLIKDGETVYCALAWSEHPAPADVTEE